MLLVFICSVGEAEKCNVSVKLSNVHICVTCLLMSRCPCDECNISHIITCGLISPEVSEQQHQQHHHHCEAESHQPPDHDSNDVTCSDDTSQVSSCHLQQPLSCRRYDLQRSYCANIKPPSVPSSDSSSCSESPIILDRCQFFGENFEYVGFQLFIGYKSMIIF